MIARTTLALMLAWPAAAAGTLVAPNSALAEARKPSRDCTSATSQSDRAGATRRGRAERISARRGATRTNLIPAATDSVGGRDDDGLAYDTPRDIDGRPLPEAEPIPLAGGGIGHPWQTGIASWYGGSRWQGRQTSSGQRYDENQLTAAHATLPLGSRVRVRLVGGAREVVVVITDRPGTRRRIIDLSRGAAERLGILSQGVARVAVDPI